MGGLASLRCRLCHQLPTLQEVRPPRYSGAATIGEISGLVLLKAAAEWIIARYQRGVENWVRQREEWEKEKNQWEAAHPALTPDIRDRFTGVFRQLNDPQRSDKPGLRRKNPRICSWERLKQNIDNCIYAGEKGHGPLCWKYVEFVKARKERDGKFNDKRFGEDAEKLIHYCAEKQVKPANAFLSTSVPNILFKELPRQEQGLAMQRLKQNWNAYLKHMELNADTVIQHRRLPHCRKIGGKVFEQSECVWNSHTDLCLQYKRLVGQLDDATLALEPQYREWRRLYLAGPRKPSFRYPSARHLPMPKIFGTGFHEIDFENSVLRLRLDDMPTGQWIEFGFTPWPRGYKPSRKQIRDMVTSVHVNFIGSRARVGFRFDVPHKQSRFGCTQDEIDELRSRQFPRQAQDQQFLETARKRLLESFTGDAGRDLRLLAVDLGETGAHAAVYQGKTRTDDIALKIVKIDKLYAELPDQFQAKKHEEPDPRGLRKEHVGRHLTQLADGAAEIARTRQKIAQHTPVTLEDHDLRGLKRHIAWMIRDWARHNASQIVAAAEQHNCDLIVFESLRGFRPPGYDKLDVESQRKKRWLAMFAFGRIGRKVVEKAVERGMRVVTVPYFKSSQVCSACGHVQQNVGLLLKNKKDRKFKCEHCKAELNSDANAARVLARVFWGEVTLPSPQPDFSVR